MSAFLTRDRSLLTAGAAGSRNVGRAGTELLFQPRFSLSDRKLVAVEASAAHARPRLHRGQPAAREIRDIGRDATMLRDACRLAMACSPDVAPLLSLHVTEAQAASGLLARLIAEVLCDSHMPPERMELEFSEGSLQADEHDMLYLLAALRDLGVGLVLGGFGNGVSSLTLLRRRSLAGLLSGLKLDGLLVRDLVEDTDLVKNDCNIKFLHGMTESAHALGLLVIAEGIESERHHRRLLDSGCDQGLGTWLGDAMPAADYAREAGQDRAANRTERIA